MISHTDSKKWLLWIFATIAVIIIFQISYGLTALQPSNISWLMTVRHDWGTHYLGWAFYKNEPWHFPIGKVTGYNYPAGTNVGFTDSIPLLAIFFKLFAPLLSADFQYFGIWLFLCHLLAAYYTILLFRLFKVNWVVTLAATIFIASNPVLVYRGMHPALCGQWMLIAGIYYYFLNIQNSHWKRILLYQFLLLTFSALINPYLCWMVMGFSFATPIKLCFYEKLFNWKYLTGYVVISLFSVWLLLFITGMVGFQSKEAFGVNGAYGLYGLNLNALYNPVGYSTILPQLKQVSWHQYEGFMYLGVGMLLLLFVLFIYYGYRFISGGIKKEKTPATETKGNKSILPLLVLAIGYAVFSITFVFTFNDKVLFRIPAPGFFKKLEEIFRASARFFWMPYYLIVLFTIIGIAKSKIRPLISSSLVVLALAIQLYDITPLLTSKTMTYGTYKPPMHNADWIKLMSQFDEILFFPAFNSPKIRSMDYQDFSYLALKAGKPVNLAYVPREDSRAIRSFTDSLTGVVQSGKLSPKALYITNASNLEYFSKAVQEDGAILNTMDSCFYIYAKEPENGPPDAALNGQLRSRSQAVLDSVLRITGRSAGFVDAGKLTAKADQSIRYHIETINIAQGVVSLDGWAFIDSTQNNKNDSIFITLISDDKSYLAPAKMSQRQDIANSIGKPNLNKSGLAFLAFTDNVERGKYQLGIAIKDAQGRFVYQTTGKEVRVKIPDYSTPESITQLPATGKIVYDLKLSESGPLSSVGGWAALEGQDADSSTISLVLKSNDHIYLFPTEPYPRPDVTASFGNRYNLDNSGYSVKFRKTDLQKGKYRIGLLIKDARRKTECVVFSDQEIAIQ